MNIKLGWSGEINGNWTKMDVEVEEVDLNQHFVNSGIDDPSQLRYSAADKFKLMYALGEIFVHLHKMSRFPEIFGTSENKKELSELIETRDKLTSKISSSLAPF